MFAPFSLLIHCLKKKKSKKPILEEVLLLLSLYETLASRKRSIVIRNGSKQIKFRVTVVCFKSVILTHAQLYLL